MYAVYKITAPNGKSYIGMTGREPAQRWANGTAYRKNKRLYRDIQLYGWENFTQEVIAAELTKEQAAALEIEYIKKTGSRSPARGYNKSTGGTSGGAGIKPTKATRRRISKALTGRPSPMRGKQHTEETRQRMSESKTGRRSPKEKPVYCLTTGKQYLTMRKAAAETGNSYRAIRAVCVDRMKTADGREWLFIA